MPKTILVVDDEMLIALDIQSQLEDRGQRVFVASNVANALALADRESIDVAIIDWYIGNEIGAQLVDILEQRQIPFVVCSGSALEQLADLYPAAPILTKPFASDDLFDALNRVVEGV